MKSFATLLLLLCSIALFSQEKYTISGYIRDAANGEELIGASVYSKDLSIGVAANVYGFYSLTLPAGEHEIVFSFIGYQDISKKVNLTANMKIDMELGEAAEQLAEVEITAEAKNENVKSLEMSVNRMDAKTIKRIPALLGEADVIKSVLLLPGVTTVGEGATGFNVRGGGIDQNLVLLDEAPVYNSSHLLGFFSVFNPDAVKNVKLVKGGIPAQYGGRLSSILDVRLKEGNSKKLSASGGMGVIFSRLAIEGPLAKDKASFIVAGRRSYIDVLARPFLSGDNRNSSFYFYDLTAKVNYRLNDNNRLFLSGYFGRDVLGLGNDFIFNWGNSTATARWNHIFNSRLFMNVTGFYSNYDYEFGVSENSDDDAFNWRSKIINYSVKPELTYYLNSNNTIRFGGQSTYYQFKPAEASFASGGETNDISLPDRFAIESGIYVSNEQKIGARLSLQYGLRLSNFNTVGDGEKITLGDTTAGLRRPVIATEQVDKWESISSYSNLEPRLAIKYDLDENSSLKASYNRMSQYLHLISNTVAATPIDVWTPSSNNIEPQIADQVALGYFRNFKKNSYETSVEVFYKDMQNQIDYIDNADIFFNDQLDADLLSGDGVAYGAEFFVKKVDGKINGWVSYTLSRSERRVRGLNRDEWFPNRFDRTHNLSVVGNYDLNERWVFSANFVLSSGTPGTFPTNRIQVQGFVIPHNADNERNSYRIPAYHRLDLSATLQQKKNSERRWQGEWVFSVYNVYSRRNPFSIYFQVNEDNPTITEAIRYSIVGNFVPAVAYNFKF